MVASASAWAKRSGGLEDALARVVEPISRRGVEAIGGGAQYRPTTTAIARLESLATRHFISALFRRGPFELQLDTAPDPPRLRDRFLLRHADTILVGDDDIALAAIRAGARPRRVVSRQIWDFRTFSAIPPYREPTEGHRMVFVGALSPISGSSDLQLSAARWAERHPEREISITWVGDGDLRAVLDAQPLPPNMRQDFVGPLAGEALAAIFGRCGLLVVPHLAAGTKAPLREAAASGLPVIGSSRDPLVMSMLMPGETGWFFDPLQPGSMFGALDDAMSAASANLNDIRMSCRTWALRGLPKNAYYALAPGPGIEQ